MGEKLSKIGSGTENRIVDYVILTIMVFCCWSAAYLSDKLSVQPESSGLTIIRYLFEENPKACYGQNTKKHRLPTR